MHAGTSHLTLHAARPAPGRDLRQFVRELSKVAGVAHVAPLARFSRLLKINYNPGVIDARVLLERARRSWGAVQLVRVGSAAAFSGSQTASGANE